jgi:hypothetical protein
LISSKLALLEAKALDAIRNANPSTRLLEALANVMTAPFSFPKLRRETVGAARLTTYARKHWCFAANRLQCKRWGSADKARALFRCARGFSHLGRQTDSERIP